MTIEDGRFWILRWGRLVDDELARPLIDVKTMIAQVNGERPQAIRYPVSSLVVPLTEYPAGVAPKRYDVA